MKRRIVFAAIAALCLSACGKNGTPADTTTAATSVTDTSAAETTIAETEAQSTEGAAAGNEESGDAPHYEYDVYCAVEDIIFSFTSGVGAWETSLTVEPDGAFSGQFNDFNMGEDGEDYPEGTVYACRFKGMFAEPERVSSTIWKTKVDSISYETLRGDKEEEYIEENLRHLFAEPYGLTDGAEILFYLSGTPSSDLAQAAIDWLWWRMDLETEEIEESIIYNVTNEAAFCPDHYAMGDFEYGSDDPAGYLAFSTAYEYQLMADPQFLPALPIDAEPRKYKSVTLKNLQGRWVNRYEEGGSQIEEILSLNGDYGQIECYKDGTATYAWNGYGHASIEDRSDRNLCPAFRINDDTGSNICTIYIRKVEEDHFVDGGFNVNWTYEPANADYAYLQYTVTQEMLQGVWYSEYTEGSDFSQVVLHVDGDRATLFETINGEPSTYWNGAGTTEIIYEEFYPGKFYPELILHFDEGPSAGSSAGIYINNVDDEKFYDPGFGRWFWKITPQNYWE